MTVLHVAQRGEPILNLVATAVSEAEFSSPWLFSCVEALKVTMIARHGVGIAAPQVYISKRIIIVASKPNPRYPDAPEMEAIEMINPEILEFSDILQLGEEGCLSVESQRGQVLRAEKVTVQYYNLVGEKIQNTFSGFPARIVQHEIDHLNGILFVDRIVLKN